MEKLNNYVIKRNSVEAISDKVAIQLISEDRNISIEEASDILINHHRFHDPYLTHLKVDLYVEDPFSPAHKTLETHHLSVYRVASKAKAISTHMYQIESQRCMNLEIKNQMECGYGIGRDN